MIDPHRKYMNMVNEYYEAYSEDGRREYHRWIFFYLKARMFPSWRPGIRAAGKVHAAARRNRAEIPNVLIGYAMVLARRVLSWREIGLAMGLVTTKKDHAILAETLECLWGGEPQ